MVEDLSLQLARRGHEVAVATLRQPMGPPPARRRRRGPPAWTAPCTASPASRSTRSATTRRRFPTRRRPRACAGCCASCGPTSSTPTIGSSTPTCRWPGAPAPPLVLSLHDYGILCPTKRLFYKGDVCSGPGPLKCMRHAFEYYGAGKGTMVATGTRLSEPWVRRRVDMFLSVSSAVEKLCRVRPDDAHRIVPNFVGELPAAPVDADEHLTFLPEGPFVLYFGDVAEDKGAWQPDRRPPGAAGSAAPGADRPAQPRSAAGRAAADRARRRCRTHWRSRRCGARCLPLPPRSGRSRSASSRSRRPQRASRSSPPTSAACGTSSPTARPGSWSGRGPRPLREALERMIGDAALRGGWASGGAASEAVQPRGRRTAIRARLPGRDRFTAKARGRRRR